MRKRVERAYGSALRKTLSAVNPIKKAIIETHCKVHLFINEKALEILQNEGHEEAYDFFEKYIHHINRGLIWADQDFKSYHHFYNPHKQKGKFGFEENAYTLAKKYYSKALKHFAMGKYEKSMFYFGAATHLIQDLTIPQHAKGKLLDNHRQFENYIKENYNKMKKFTVEKGIINLENIGEYADYNSKSAINIEKMYEDIDSNKARFYLLGCRCLPLAQKTSAGCMLMFYNDLFS